MAASTVDPSPALVTLLTDLSLHAIAAELYPTALFFAERLQALRPSNEAAVWLLALCHVRAGRPKAAIKLLSETIVGRWSPPSHAASQTLKGKGKARDVFGDDRELDSHSIFQLTAADSSVRCASLYAQACGQVGQPREGQQHLREVLELRGSAEPNDLVVPSTSAFALSAAHVLSGHLALAAHDPRRAAVAYQAALDHTTGPLIWEAYEGLCKTGEPTASADHFSSEARLFAALGSSAPAVNGTHLPPAPPTAKVASLFTPPEPPGKMLPPKKSSLWEPSRLMMAGGEMSIDESSLDQSYYYNRQRPGPFKDPPRPAPASKALWHGEAPSSLAKQTEEAYQAGLMLRNPSTSSSSSFATPSASDAGPTNHIAAPLKAPPGVKRTRGGATNGKGKAAMPDPIPHPPLPPPPARRSERVRETTAEGRPIAGTSRVVRGTSASGRDRKRAKSGETFDDVVSSPEAAFDTNARLAPIPSSSLPENAGVNGAPPGPVGAAVGNGVKPEDPERQAAVAWVANTLRRFTKATYALSTFNSQSVLDAVWGLPPEQKRTWRAYCLIGRAKFELLDYQSAEIAFTKARQVAPHMVEHMDLYSTLLWHLRKPVELSCLAQELQVADPLQSESWIATGNVFSLIDDHANALRCFKRAAQLAPSKPYAFTLSGHECVGLEEWDRALGFFREAIRRDVRHYNAWFGMGDVYLKQGQFRLAEFHFRQAAKLNPTNALLLCAIGNVLEKRGKPKEARDMYERGVELAPGAATVRFHRAKILVALKQYELARDDLIVLKDAEPTEFNVHFLLGKVYALTGDKASAARELAYAQDLDPRSAARVRKVLEGGSDDIEEDTSRDEPHEVQTRLDAP